MFRSAAAAPMLVGGASSFSMRGGRLPIAIASCGAVLVMWSVDGSFCDRRPIPGMLFSVSSNSSPTVVGSSAVAAILTFNPTAATAATVASSADSASASRQMTARPVGMASSSRRVPTVSALFSMIEPISTAALSMRRAGTARCCRSRSPDSDSPRSAHAGS